MSFVSIDSDITSPRFGSAWRDKEGAPHATVRLGASALYLDFSTTADAVIAALTEARDALAALEAEGPQQEGEDRG